ncbi:MAG: hypothetical protein GY814_14565, partial [Gammaproteobacteria bacterium]|nr:hypothetical protein [Gammaproteobacteria bacterium]
MYSQSRRNRNAVNVWPGFVDALASVLLVFIFMLLIFVVGQFFLTDILMGRNQELYQLAQDVDVLRGKLIVEKHQTSTQRKRIDELGKNLRTTTQDRDRLKQSLLSVVQERERLEQEQARLDQELQLKLREIASLQEDISALRTFRQELENKVADMALALERQKLDLEQAAEQGARDRSLLSSQGQTIAELEALRDRLRSELAELSTALTLKREDLMAVRDRSKVLAQKLSDEEERTRLAQVDIDKKDIRLQELRELLAKVDQSLADEKQLTAQQQQQLNEKDLQLLQKWKQLAKGKASISMQREEIDKLRSELDLSTTLVDRQQIELDRLNAELNRELASKVKELSSYRSEFFGRLREVLGDHPDIHVVGDRFMFQSELLFASASA